MKTLNCLQVPNDPSCQVLLTSNIMIFKSFSTLNLPQYNKEFFYNWENTISMTGQYLSAANTLNGLCKELQVFLDQEKNRFHSDFDPIDVVVQPCFLPHWQSPLLSIS